MPYIDSDICTGCGLCAEACKQQALRMQDGVAVIDSAACTGCNRCLAACPTGAIRAAELVTAAVSTSDSERSNASSSSPQWSPGSQAAADSATVVELAPQPAARCVAATGRPFPPAVVSGSAGSPVTAEPRVALARKVLSAVLGLAGWFWQEGRFSPTGRQAAGCGGAGGGGGAGRGGGGGARHQRQRSRQAARPGRGSGWGGGAGRGRSCSSAARGRR